MRAPGEAALVVVHRLGGSDREFLVALRAPGPRPEGYWSLITGGIEEEETPTDAARRELEEETALAAPLSFEAIPMSLGFEAEEGWVVLHVFAAEAPAGWEPTLDEEHVDSRWCTAEEALAVLHYDEPRQALREVARRLEVTT